MRLFIFRLILVVCVPPILSWTFVARLAREIGSAFWYAQNEVRQEMESVRQLWRKPT